MNRTGILAADDIRFAVVRIELYSAQTNLRSAMRRQADVCAARYLSDAVDAIDKALAQLAPQK